MSTTPALFPVPPLADAPDATDPTWWKDAVVYQIYPRSFADSNGDGIGDLRGIIDRVDHLAALGVQVVWLSPIYCSPQDDNGYDISDYQAIDPTFGTLADFDELLAALHARGIRLVMDLVVNHTSDEHAWFEDSRSSTASAKRDWYIWRDAREVEGLVPGERGTEPNNWDSAFSGPGWEWDAATEQFYLHMFSRKQPDLNWENPEVREAVYAMMRWWLERGVDGFRMDVINLISKPEGLPDGPATQDGLGSAFAMVMSGPRFHEFMQEMHREVFDRFPKAFVNVGETPGITTADALLTTLPTRRELDMVFQFEHVGLEHDGHKFEPSRALGLWEFAGNLAAWDREVAAAGGWNSLYVENHDQPRSVSRWGDDSPEWRVRSAKALAGMLHAHRGTPYVYQGQELGQINYPWAALEEFRDIEVLNYVREAEKFGHGTFADLLPGISDMNRDNARTPVQWTADTATAAGFTSDGTTPWIGTHPEAASINAAAQVGIEGSVFEFYRALIALRHSEPLLVSGDFELLGPVESSGQGEPGSTGLGRLWAIRRPGADGAALYALANFSRAPLEVPDEWWPNGAEVLLSNVDPAERAGERRLGGWEYVLLKG
ncbi:MAG: alpha-glucosidase [Dermabacter sp.]|nr:alpha-glucosidase [Dermabacter sp.]